MFWIGLTGSIGSGKSEVANRLRSKGYVVLDADQVAREVLNQDKDILSTIRREFGEKVIQPDSTLDRRELGKITFGDKNKMARLEAILHPAIRRAVEIEKKKLQDLGLKMALYDVPLLFEKKLEDGFDRVVVVYAPDELRRERILKRNQLTEVEVDARMASQLPMADKVLAADFVVQNTSDLKHLDNEVERLDAYLQAQR